MIAGAKTKSCRSRTVIARNSGRRSMRSCRARRYSGNEHPRASHRLQRLQIFDQIVALVVGQHAADEPGFPDPAFPPASGRDCCCRGSPFRPRPQSRQGLAFPAALCFAGNHAQADLLRIEVARAKAKLPGTFGRGPEHPVQRRHRAVMEVGAVARRRSRGARGNKFPARNRRSSASAEHGDWDSSFAIPKGSHDQRPKRRDRPSISGWCGRPRSSARSRTASPSRKALADQTAPHRAEVARGSRSRKPGT